MPKKRPTKKTTGRAPAARDIDKLDREILALVNRRAELAARRTASQADTNVAADGQEAKLRSLVEASTGPLPAESVRAVFRELVSGSRTVGRPLRIAFLGPEFTFSHLAAIERFGHSAEMVPVGAITSVFEEIERGHADFGLVPIENSTDGRIGEALDCLARSPLKICGELPLRIRQCLLGQGERKDVTVVASKSQPLSQCRNWLAKHLPQAEIREVASTAEAARMAAKEKNVAAIASEQAGVHHGLGVLARNIEDNPDNVTRFAVVGHEIGAKTGNDKTSIVFEVDHKPGALADAMTIFKRNRLNMTWIESFPVPGLRGRYLFFVEFQGHASELRARRALASLEKKALRLTTLGSYAQCEPVG